MLKITIPAGQGWNSVKEEFVNPYDTTELKNNPRYNYGD